MAKPASKPNWTFTNPDQATISVEPTVQKKIDGWFPDERPPREFMNWLFQNISEWISYLDGEIDEVQTQKNEYDAIIGFGGTHASINALMADANVADYKNVLVTGSLLVDAIQVISQPGMNFYFKPQAAVVKGVSGTGIRIDAPRTRILNARFLNFDVKAIVTTANAKNCMIMGCMFNNCPVTIDDALGLGNILANNLEEV